MHEEPQVPNYRTGRRGRKLEPGLCLAIEPMFTLGDYRAHVLADDWTVSTVDGSLAAHFEHHRIAESTERQVPRRSCTEAE